MDAENSDTRCDHGEIYWSEENDNLYCKYCNAGMGNGVYSFVSKLKNERDALRRQNERLREALKEVLSHRKEDKDGNYVMWIGEGTFLKCEQALSNET